MITLDMLDRVKLSSVPSFQIFVAKVFLTPLYNARNLKIVFEGAENFLDQPVIFIMNHTDRYNYWPFQYHLYNGTDHNAKYRYTTTWVKGKYYEHPLMAKFMNAANNIPIPSRGYLLVKDFELLYKSKEMNNDEYRALRDYVDNKISKGETEKKNLERIVKLITTPHGDFDPDKEDYRDYIRELFTRMMSKVRELNEDALFNKKLNLIIFPEGTRSKRLKKGHIGASEVALSSKVPVIPIGSNGCDKCYPGNLPIVTKNCTVVYRIGKPLTIDGELAPFKIDEDFVPFTPEAEAKYRDKFEGATELMMSKINDLLDPEYKMADDIDNDSGAKRFV